MSLRTPQYKIAPCGADYSLAVASGALTLVAAAGPVWSCRWTSATHVAVIKRMIVSSVIATAFGTAQDLAYGLYFARSYTAVDSGGTAATLTTNNGKHDTNYPTMQMADIRISTTGAITAGTRTLDAQALRLEGGTGAAALAVVNRYVWDFGEDNGRQPLMLREQEGLVLANEVLMGASGVVTLRVTLEWAEVNKSLV